MGPSKMVCSLMCQPVHFSKFGNNTTNRWEITVYFIFYWVAKQFCVEEFLYGNVKKQLNLVCGCNKVCVEREDPLRQQETTEQEIIHSERSQNAKCQIVES